MRRKVFIPGIFSMWLIAFLFSTNTAAQVIKWSTYLNTVGDDQLQSMVKDNAGDIYILGSTNANGFPVTPGAAQTGLIPNSFKATISKISGTTGNLIWSTYLGGDQDNIVVAGFVWDAASNTVALSASTSSRTYPVVGGIAEAAGAVASAVFTQLDAVTGAIIYSTHTFSNKLPLWGVPSTVNNTPVTLYRAAFRTISARGAFFNLSLDSTHKKILVSKINLVTHQIEYQKSIAVNNGTILPSISFSSVADVAPYYLGFAVDNEEVFISGLTNANDYPTTPGSYQPVYPAGGNDAYFITKLNVTGDIAFSTFANNCPQRTIVPSPQIAVTNSEVALYTAVGAGITVSQGGIGFNSISVANNGLLKLNRQNGAPTYFSYLGGPLQTYVYPSLLQATANGDLIIKGISSSPYLPTTPNAIQPYQSYFEPRGYEGPDCYFIHFNSQNRLVYCTYLGGAGYDAYLGASIQGDNVFIPMLTASNNFPITANATQLVNKGTGGTPSNIVVVAGEYVLIKYSIPEEKITYAGFIGTNVNDAPAGGLVADGDVVYLPLKATHYNSKPLLKDFPVSADALQKTMTGQNNTNGIADHQYIAKINTATGKLLYGSYIGSLPVSKGESGKAMIVDGDDIYLAGQSRASDYPVTQGAIQTTYLDSSDIYVTKLSLCHTVIINDSITPKNISVCANSIVPVITGSVPEIVNPSVILRNNIPQPVSGLSNFSYQWQQSTTGTVWSNITGATGRDFQPAPLSSSRYFRRIAVTPSCENSDTSNVTLVSLNGLEAARPDAGGIEGNYFACPSSNIQTGTPAVPGLVYSWQPAAGLLHADSAQTVFNSPVPGVYIYELTATDSNGCTSRDTAVIFNYKANAGPDRVLCNNKAVTIGSFPLAGIPGITYSWQPAAGLSCTDCPQPLANTTGTYILTVNALLPQGGNCITTDTVVITSANISSQPGGNDTTICVGQSAVLGTPRVPGFTYNWTPGNFINAIVDTAQPVFNRSKSTLDLIYNPAVYILTANNPSGCTITDTVNVYVNYPYTGMSGCRPIQLGKEDNTNGQAVYEWLLADGSPVPPGELSGINIANPVALYNTAVPDRTYLLKKTWNGLTCTNTVNVFSNCICPPVQLDFRSPTGCPTVTNDSLTMYVTNPSPNFIYTWSPSTGLNTNTGTRVKSGVTIQTQYTVTATSIFDSLFYCGSGQIWVNNPDTTSPVFNVNDTVICRGQTVNIGVPEVTGLRYEWTTSASGGAVVSASSNPAVTGDKNIIYYADVSDPVSGCHTYDTVHIRVPEVIANAGPSRASCSGGGFTIGTAAVPGLVYAWMPATGLSNTNTAQPLVLSNTENITYTLTVQDPSSGCSDTGSIFITHIENPTIDSLRTPAPYCEGSNTSVQIGVPPLDAVIYSWSPATGLSNANIAQPFANPSVSTTYTLTAQFPGACASIATADVTVTVKPRPSVAVSGSANCDNTQLLVTTNAVRPAYSWSPATALSSTSIPNPVSVTSVPVTYSITVLDIANSCSNTGFYEVIPSVIANAGDDKEICEGSVAEIGSPSAAGAVYSWSPATGLSNYNTVQTTTLNTLPAGIYTYYITATQNGCSRTDSVKVKVNTLPIVAQASVFTICRGASVQIGTASEPGVTYSWLPVTGLSNPGISNPVANPQQTTVYTVTAFNPFTGCTATASVTVVVSPQPAPVVSISASCNEAICPGDSVRLTAIVSGGGSFTYRWSPEAGIVTSPGIRNPVVAPTETTTYTVWVSNCSNGCTATAQTTVVVKDTCNTVSPVVLPVQWLSFTAAMQKDKVLLKWIVALEQNNKEFAVERSSDGVNWNRMLIVPARGNDTGEREYKTEDTSPFYGINFYRIRQVDKDGKHSVSVVRSIMFSKKIPGFVVYPNPVISGILNYTLLNAAANTNLQLQLYDTEGRLVKTIFTITGSGYFSVGELASGTYILKMTDNNDNTITRKVLIQR